MRELLDKRSFTAKHFELVRGLYRMEAHIGHIHFRDGALKDGVFRNIDTTLNSGANGWAMTNASYEAEIGLYGGVRFHNVDHSVTFALPNPNKVQGVPYDGSAFGKLGKALIWKDIIQDGGHQVVECRNNSLAKIFHFDTPPKSNVIKFRVVGSDGLKFSDGDTGFNLDDDADDEIVDNQGRFYGSGKQSFIRQPRVWNHRGESVNIRLRFTQFGTETWMFKVIPQSFIDKTFTEAGAWLECDTTTSFYAGSGDGYVGNSGTVWSTVVGAGTGDGSTNYTGTTFYHRASFATPNCFCWRGFAPVDASSIGAAGSISAATLYLYSISLSHGGADAFVCHIVNATPASSSSLVDADFGQVGSTSFGSRDYTAITTSAYNGFAFNASGISAISLTGTSEFAFRTGLDLTVTSPGNVNQANWSTSETTGTSQDPYMDVTYSYPNPPVGLARLLSNPVYRM